MTNLKYMSAYNYNTTTFELTIYNRGIQESH